MSDTPKTKAEIIEETHNFYMEDVKRRAITSEGRCYYLDREGRMCAVGRCMIQPTISMIGRVTNFHLNQDLNVQFEDSFLKGEYRGHSVLFWQDLQLFHDGIPNWDENGLTELGGYEYLKLKQKWS